MNGKCNKADTKIKISSEDQPKKNVNFRFRGPTKLTIQRKWPED